MHTNINRLFLLSATFLLSPPAMFAANTAAPAAAVKESTSNPMLVGLVSLIIILLFVIGAAAFVLRQLAIVYREKMRAERNKGNVVKTVLLLIALSIPAFHSFAADATAQAAIKAAAPANDFISGIPANDFYMLMGIIGLEILVIAAQMAIMKTLINAISNKPVLTREAKAKKTSQFWDRFNKSVAVEKEKDVLLDHDYDGVQELDNILPPWWKYGFYVTIIVAIIYLYRYEIAHTAPSSHEEYVAEMQQAKEEKEAYLAKSANNVNESNVTQLTDAASLAAGKAVFETICFACHLKDGGGAVGPNLTDDYWLHGGSMKDIFKTIKYGYPDKGMKSWKDDYSPKQIQQIASYVRSLHGTHPATPKEKQGDLYIEARQAGVKGIDSTKAKDTATAGKITVK